MLITKEANPQLKSEICNSVLRSLPCWFGIESAIVDYVSSIQAMPTWIAYDDKTPIGFISIEQHFPASAEVHVMGILEQYHRQGIGHHLLKAAEEELRQQGCRFLAVKTLSESRPNEHYDKTRKFYLKEGFVPLQEFKALWGEENPCLFLVKSLISERAANQSQISSFCRKIREEVLSKILAF